MKKVLSILSIVITSLSLIRPFSINAENISGFDYTNYYQLDYIQSDGTNYIISNFYVSSGIYEMSVLFPSVNTSSSRYRYFGGYFSSSIRAPLTSSSSKLGYGYRGTNKDNLVVYSANTQYSITTTLSSEGSSQQSNLNVNGTSYGNTTFTGGSTNSDTYYTDIFGYNNAGSHVVCPDPLRLYYFKYYTVSGTLQHYYVPAMRKSDNAVGLYDVISNVFLGKATGNNFTYGGTIPTRYTITTSVSPSGSGTVTGGGEYDSGSQITLTATPNTGYTFLRWSDNVYTNPRIVTVNSSQSYEAIFQQQSSPVNRYTLTLNVDPAGAGVVTGGGEYDEDTTVNITATANNGYTFTQWSDGNTSANRSINVNSNITLTAQFSSSTPSPQTYAVTVSSNNNTYGSVSGGGTYEYGDTATITATANSGYVFSAWSDGITQNPRQLTVTSNITLTAYFVESLDNSKILGFNIGYYDYDANHLTQYWGYYYDSDGNIIVYPGEYDGTYNNDHPMYILNADKVVVIDFVFNDDYYGSFSYLFQTAGGHRIDGRTLYVNGNHASISFIYDDIYAFTGATMSFSNLNNLIKKQSVTAGIYDGTQESTQSEQALDTSNEVIDENVNVIGGLEDDFNDEMNDALEDIDADFSPADFGSKFQSSAIWVSQQFNRLTADTPFGSLLGFSLLLGVSLLIIGKVFG